MGDTYNSVPAVPVMGSSSSVKTLTDGYTITNSGILDISRGRKVVLGVNYTAGSAETANTISLVYDLACRGKRTITATTIAIVDGAGSADTITDSGSGFLSAGFTNGQKIIVSGCSTAANNGGYQIATAAAGTLTLVTGVVSASESAGSLITIESTTGGFYRLQNEAISAGALTRTNREDTCTQVATAGTYDRFSVVLDNISGWDYLLVWVKEGGVASNAGSVWVEGAVLGR